MSLIVTACGGGSTATSPEIGEAQEQIGGENPVVDPGDSSSPGIDPGAQTPTTDPENPGTDPGTEIPTTDPEVPGTDPETETPTTDPANPVTEPETPVTPQDDPVALSGSVSSYPESDTGEGILSDDPAITLNDESDRSSSLSRADMRPVPALVSLYLLSDVDFETPVATVKSDSSGDYTITASDVREYLQEQDLIAENDSDAQVLASFRSLGRLQVRALITRERNGVRRVMAIQSLADPSDVDESGVPVPVAIDPIVHRVVKVIVDSIRESVTSLEAMGLSPALVDQLIDSVVEEVVVQIDQIMEDTADEVIDIPEGQTLDDVIDGQEEELALDVDVQQLDQLVGVLESDDGEAQESQLTALENAVAGATELATREDSTLESTLDSESQGLLSSFESSLSDQLNGSVERRIDEAREEGMAEALSEEFGEKTDEVGIEQALAAIELEKEKQSRLSIQRFFLSLGLGVMLEENTAGDAGVLAVQLSLPFHLNRDALPGVAGLEEREIRLFKVGSGELDADSNYTSNPSVQLGVPDENGAPMPPFKFVPALDDVVAQVLSGMNPEEAQLAVDEVVGRAFDNTQLTDDDYLLLDRVDVLYELRERLHDTTLVSSSVIDTLVDNRDRKIPLKRIAAAIAEEFEWIQDDVKLTPDGFPIYSGRSGPLAGGASAVDSSELVRTLAITLGKTPKLTVRNLTESNSFLAQFAPGAVEFALQRYAFDEQVMLTDALLDIYPQEPAGYRQLITGSATGEAEPEYTRARDRVARGLTAAIPAHLYGQTLTSDSEVSIRSALFFLDFALGRDYLINANSGFYRPFEITGSDGEASKRFVPDYANVKRLEPQGVVSVATMMSELLNITAIDDGELFRQTAGALMDSLPDIPELPEHQEHSVDTYIDELGPRSAVVDAFCAVQMFDGSDPEREEEHRRLKLGVFEVAYNERTGERFKGDRVEASISSELMENEMGAYRLYRIAGLPATMGDDYGRDYVLRFTIDSYQNELPELYMYVDGFVPELTLCDNEAPLFIGADQVFVNLPGVGLVSDQSRFQFEPGTDPDANGGTTEPDELRSRFEWVDLSNFEEPGAPVYVTEQEESEGFGAGDFRLESSGGVYTLVGPADSGVGFARLFGTYVDGELQLALQSGDAMQPVYGLQSVVGANARDVIAAVASGEVSLSDSLFVGQTAAQASEEGVDARDRLPAIFADGILDDDFESQALYLFRDRDGRFWVLELRYFESYVEFDNAERAFIDLGIASVNNIGLVDVPNVNYDAALPVDEDDFETARIEYYSLYYGDWLVLESPTGYTGSDMLPPQVLAFSDTDGYEELEQAIDGVVIRYAGEHFSENIRTIDDIDSFFGNPQEFSSVPSRLDAGRAGISFIKLTFDKAEKRYVMDPLPQDAAPYVAQLKHNDLVAVFDDQSEDDGPVFLIRIVKDTHDASFNDHIGMEVLRYDTLSDNLEEFDERQVVCFFEDHGKCPEAYPALFSALDVVNMIGVVYDMDVDGVPAIFDYNDSDPNIPGIVGEGEGYPGNDGAYEPDKLTIEAVAGVDDDGMSVRALIARTNHIYPGDIESITLQSDLFGIGSQALPVLSCEPARVDDFGMFTGPRCEPHVVSGDVELEIFRQSDEDVSLLMLATPQTLQSLGEHVDFAYQVNYRTPMDLEGRPLMCGTDACPGLPASSGVISVPVGRDIPVHGQVSVQVEGEPPVELLGLRKLDVDREIRVSAAALPGAVEYELGVYCPSSAQAGDDGSQSDYQPEEYMSYFAPARDEFGLQVPPEFKLHMSWLAGRECRISLRSHIETESGEIAGTSLYVQGGVLLTGSMESPVFIDNESAFKTGDFVCVEDGSRLGVNNCTQSASLFMVESMEAQPDGQGELTLTLGDAVINAHAEGYSRPLLEARLGANAEISFDRISEGMPPMCGEISGTAESYSTCQMSDDALSTLFIVSDDGAEMQLMLPDIVIEGPLTQNGNISLTEPGYYQLIQVPEGANAEANLATDSSVARNVQTGYVELMAIMIEAYETDTGDREVYAMFESKGQNDSLDGSVSERQLRIQVPGYVYIQSADGYDIGMDMRTILDEQVKLSFHVNQLMQMAGSHDLNEDGIPDIEVWSEGDLWYFNFAPTVDDARDLMSPDGQSFPVDPSGMRMTTYPADRGYAEMLVRLADREYLLAADFNAAGAGSLQILDKYPLDEQMIEPLFDGRDLEHFFPVQLSAASPFTRDIVDVFDQQGFPVTGFPEGPFDGIDFGETPTSGGADGQPEEQSQDVIEFSEADEFDEPFDEAVFTNPFVMPSAIITSGFHADAERIAGILRGRFNLAQFFRTDGFRAVSTDAGCFGPALYYQDHPDGVDGELMMGFTADEQISYASLPHGDLGIWTEYDQDTGDACAAAQMNAQLAAARKRTFTGLATLASVVRRLTPEQQADVMAGSEVSVADKMNALSLPGVEFEQAQVSMHADTGEWHYTVSLYDSYADDGAGPLRISIEMLFNPGSDADRWDYSGNISFRIEDRSEESGCADGAVEHLSSTTFQREAEDLLKTEYRYGMVCGHGGVSGFDDEAMVDPSYSAIVAEDGWKSNFAVFVANVNPFNGSGRYAYSWQAGAGDSHSRVLNVGLDDVEPINGEAWYGYGQSLTDGIEMVGEINGFICNWAGPGNDHSLIEKAQRQSLMYDELTDMFVVPEGGSNITYAPTVACTYDSDSGGSFLYDRNLDGRLGDESAETVDVGSGEQLPFDLEPQESSSDSGLDIEEVILQRGYVKPESPMSAR
ncbi:MAG: hypothetical protein AB8B63_01385 [Granulosicoccus sp.]